MDFISQRSASLLSFYLILLGGRQPPKRSYVAPDFSSHCVMILTEDEQSISLYHEILEAATVAAHNPLESVLEFNEAEFERAAGSLHARLGRATPERLNQMLAEFGFKD